MAGRVLRSSNGRFAGSTKGWGVGRRLAGSKFGRAITRGPVAKANQTKKQIATHTAKRAAYAGGKRVLINSAKIVAKGAAVGAIGGAVAGGILAHGSGLGGKATLRSAANFAKMGAQGGALQGAIWSAIKAPGSFRAAAGASAKSGLSNRAAAQYRRTTKTLTGKSVSQSSSMKKVYNGTTQTQRFVRGARKLYGSAK